MKLCVWLLSLGFLLIHCKQGPKASTSGHTPVLEVRDSISALIDSLYSEDQKIQFDLTQAARNGEQDALQQLLLNQQGLFKRHIPILKSIYRQIGYPTQLKVGQESSSRFFTLVQHADSDVRFQEKMLEEITQELEKGHVRAKDYAFLTDRVQLALGKPQIYGTQVDYNTTLGQAFAKNLVDSIDVNVRRKKIGLDVLQVYLNEASKMHFEMNRAYYEGQGISEPKLYSIE